MKRMTKGKFSGKNIDSDSSFGEDDEQHMKDLIETSEKNQKFNLLKRRFALSQKELLQFVDNFEFFVGYSVKIKKKNLYVGDRRVH